VILTDNQGSAIREIETWYKSLEFDDQGKLLEGQKQVFRVFGYAGVGKTTITKHAINELGLSMDSMQPDVRFAAFTGKASYVMRKHGTPARTIHSLIYSVHEATEQEIEEAKKKLEQLKVQAIGLSGIDRTLADAQIVALATDIKNMKKPRFGLNEASEVANTKLLVLDEVSMVGNDMAADILSFRKPVLVLGDPGQLPPIKGEGAFTQQKPDVMLTEIHRQAAESAIIRLATMARRGEQIPYGRHDDLVWKMTRRDVMPENLLNGGQVICGRNATRFELNNAMRRAAGFDPKCPYPSGPEEKVICLKNDGSRGLINGMFIEMSNPEEVILATGLVSDLQFKAVIKTEEGDFVGSAKSNGDPRPQRVYLGHFMDHVVFDPDRNDRDWKEKKGMIEATFGWSITCHKAQGSQWQNIIVWDDGLGRTRDDRARWLYTAITRAEEGLVILD
jgi:exodeoxyribonuclease-5